jgi:two-component system cell cycle sensor histidine kinase/response regulator CckA
MTHQIHDASYQELEKEVADRTRALRESEERFRRLAEASFEGVVISEKGVILDVNELYCDMLGYTRSELLGHSLLAWVAPQLQERVKHYIETDYDEPYESVMLKKDGSQFPIEVRARTVPYDGRLVRVAAIRDISERKMMEQEKIRLERVNAIGELVQGVAHNFNNLLVGMLGNAQLIQMRSKDEEVLGDANLIVESALRAKELVRRLQVSIQGDREYTLAVDVNEVIQRALELTRPRWQDESHVNGVVVVVDLRLNFVSPVWGAWERLRDVMVNLILNAVEAMPNGGTLTIETKMVDKVVHVVFTDTGIGMNEEIRRRVFEPFFTTKSNVGSGLGLSLVQGTIKSWGGTVEIESAEGKGTRVMMQLPAYENTEQS